MKIDNLFDFAKRVMSDFDYKGYKLGVVYGIDGDYSFKNNFFKEAMKKKEEMTTKLRKNNIDVSEIAKKLGMIVGYSGGGHKHASGCRICDKDEMKKKMMEIFEHSMNRIKIL